MIASAVWAARLYKLLDSALVVFVPEDHDVNPLPCRKVEQRGVHSAALEFDELVGVVCERDWQAREEGPAGVPALALLPPPVFVHVDDVQLVERAEDVVPMAVTLLLHSTHEHSFWHRA